MHNCIISREMFEPSKVCNEKANDTKIEEQIEEESSCVQDDYKKLKQENERYRQELYVLRLKMQASNALEKDLQEANESLEQSLAQCKVKTEKLLAERKEKYRAERVEYENQIANLERNSTQNAQKITELYEEIRKYKDIINEQSHNLTYTEDTLAPYKEKIEELTMLFQNEERKREQLEEKLESMENQYSELEDILRLTKEQLMQKNTSLETAREKLATQCMELESLKIAPASDTCKGNSLFAEVEDRRQKLLDKMKVLHDKYNEAKHIISTKTNEIRVLKTEKVAMVRKWEKDSIDTLQGNANLLSKYKNKIFELEKKLKIEMKKNNQKEGVQPIGNNYNYAQSLLAAKKKELEELNEKLGKQSMELLAQEETNHNILKQIRYWRTKTICLSTQIIIVKEELQRAQSRGNDNEALLSLYNAIKKCVTADDEEMGKRCSESEKWRFLMMENKEKN